MKLIEVPVQVTDVAGTDLTVVNAARVSFAKHKTEFDNNDEKLIKYLADHEHWSPFAHTFMQFKINAPIFVSRQLVKHQVGLVWNEISRRYVEDEPKFFKPKEFRGKPKDKKQGSSEEIIDINPSTTTGPMMVDYYDRVMDSARWTYNHLLSIGVCPEQARFVLPQATMTSWYWSGSLYAFSRVCKLRLKEDTQAETRDIAKEISKACKAAFPISWKYLMRPVP